MAPSLSLPPLECWPGVSPSEAEEDRQQFALVGVVLHEQGPCLEREGRELPPGLFGRGFQVLLDPLEVLAHPGNGPRRLLNQAGLQLAAGQRAGKNQQRWPDERGGLHPASGDPDDIPDSPLDGAGANR